jgi:DNA-binding phage protein
MDEKLTPFDSTDYLGDEASITAFLEAAWEEGCTIEDLEERLAYLAFCHQTVQAARTRWTLSRTDNLRRD